MNTEMFSKAGVLWASWMPRKPAAPSSPLPPTVSLPSSPSALPRTTGGSGVCSSIIFWRRTTRAKNSGAKLSTVLSHGGGSENTLPALWVTSPQRPHPGSPWLQASCGHPQWALHCSWEKCGSEDEILDDHTVLAQHCGSICCVFLSTAVFFSSRIHSSFTYFLFSQSRCAFLSPWPFLPSDKPSTMSSLPHLSSPERVLFCTRHPPHQPFSHAPHPFCCFSPLPWIWGNGFCERVAGFQGQLPHSDLGPCGELRAPLSGLGIRRPGYLPDVGQPPCASPQRHPVLVMLSNTRVICPAYDGNCIF